MSAPSHVTISRRDWKHELARCGVCGSGLRLELAEAAVRIGEADEEITYACPRCDAVTVFQVSDTPATP